MGEPEEAFRMWVADQPRGPGQMGLRGAVLKSGPQVCKTVTYADYGNPETGVVSRRELRMRSASRSSSGLGFDFDAARSWACENEEVDRLLAFLHDEVAESGRYRVVDMASPVAAMLELMSTAGAQAGGLAESIAAHPDLKTLVTALVTTDTGRSAVEGAVLAARRDLVQRLQRLAADPASTETTMHAAIGDAHWLFGGRYVGVAERRNLTMLDQFDIPLLGVDGTLHIVELKSPVIPQLVRRHRSHFIVGKDVHEATSQAMNYLRSVDEQGAVMERTFRNELGTSYDMRRVMATVVLGHPDHVTEGDERQIDQTIRTYNSHLSRVEVVTYKSLLDAAERALEFEEAAIQGAVSMSANDTRPDSVSPPMTEPNPWTTTESPWSMPTADPWSDEPPF